MMSTNRRRACLLAILLPCLVPLAARLAAFEPQFTSLNAARMSGPLAQSCALDFADVPLGRIPADWLDLTNERPSRNWGVDASGTLRFIEKHRLGLLAERACTSGTAAMLATFSKTEDADVTVGLALRTDERGTGYALLLDGRNELLLVRRDDASTTLLASLALLQPYRRGEHWTLLLCGEGRELSGAVFDATGTPLGQVDAVDDRYCSGSLGLIASEFVGVHQLERAGAATAGELTGSIHAVAAYQGYELAAPTFGKQPAVIRPLDALAPAYDLIVAGAGTGGVCAAVQAARMGCSVLLSEETDWIGGQMASAAVTSIDEGHVYRNYQDRERGLYREFHEAMLLHYYGMEKTPWQAYYSNNSPRQQEMGGYEPRAAEAMLYALLEGAARTPGARLDVVLRARVTAVQRDGSRVTGVTLTDSLEAKLTRAVASKILIDATEYGDVLPLAGAEYRAGNTRSGKLNLDATPQDNTWTCVLREYPAGIPPELRITTPPPDYEAYRQGGFANYVRPGLYELTTGTRMWRSYLAWRGMADSAGPLHGRASENRHTRCGLNGGNDYPTTVRGIEDPAQRMREELQGIHRTLAALYYFQNEVGVPWSLAVDGGYATPYNREMMRRRGVEPEYLPLVVHMPQRPYVRESRRVIGMRTLRAGDLGRFERWSNQPHAVAMGDYGVDLHRTEEYLEHELDAADYDRRGGPFQVPVEVFIPATIDGLLVAEKNLSQSRIASGATRLQPVTMLTGQAAGALAAVAICRGRQPRELNVLDVQDVLLRAGSTLVPRWYRDIAWGSEPWRATQLLSLHAIWDMPGPLSEGVARLGTVADWGWDVPLQPAEAEQVRRRMEQVLGRKLGRGEISTGADLPATRGAFALRCAALLLAQASIAMQSEPLP